MKPETILSALEQVQTGGDLPMHMPGHKRNSHLAPYLRTLGAELDITEIEGSDCLHHPQGMILESMNLAKSLWHSGNSYLLVNGSSGGILSAIHASTRRGDRVLMARACHKSVYNGVALCGLEVDYLLQRQLPQGYYTPVTPAQVAEGLKEYPDTKLVIITSPTYEGYLSDVEQIGEICHTNGTILLVDEAHGAHLGFCDYFTGSALRAGADIVIQSLHKTLPSLTQTAIAHIQGNLVRPQQFAASLGVFETSSPSYLLMASIDGCLHLMAERGEELFAQWQKNLEIFYGKCEALQNLTVVIEPCQIKDPSKIVISTQNANLDGNGLKNRLREDFHIELEMAYGDYALAMTGMGDTAQSLARLSDALIAIDGDLQPVQGEQPRYALEKFPNQMLPTHQTHNCEIIPLPPQQAVGHICGSYIWVYPPGVPIIAPGEEISADFVELLTRLEASGVEIQDTLGCYPHYISTISQ